MSIEMFEKLCCDGHHMQHIRKKSTMRFDLKSSDGSVGPNVTVSFTVGGSGNNNNLKLKFIKIMVGDKNINKMM